MVTRLFYHWPPVPLVTRAHLRSCLGWIAAVVCASAEIAKFYTNSSISTRSTLHQRCLAHGDWSTLLRILEVHTEQILEELAACQ